MDAALFIHELAGGPIVVRGLIADLPAEALHLRPAPDQWSIRDVLCHLTDEERYDFRALLKAALQGDPWPQNHPSREDALVEYGRANPQAALADWQAERGISLDWLRGLGGVNWDTTITAPWGSLRAGDILASWAAHDTHHQRQIIRLRYLRLKTLAAPYGLEYAGEW